MTTIPESTWEEARVIRNAVNWNSNSSVEHIAHALHRARQEATEKGWQPIETYPKDSKWALAYHVMCFHADKRWMRMGKHYSEIDKWYYSGTNERSQWAQVEGDEPTHWRPLPEPPTGEASHE